MFASVSSFLFAQELDFEKKLGDAGGILETIQNNLMIILIVGVLLNLLYIICNWIIFNKAGYPGWAQFIPIYNLLVVIWIAGKPTWWILLLLVPIVNIFIAFSILFGFCRNFGHGVGFALGLIFLGFIFVPVLAFGSSEYIGQRGDAY